jgi:hypothetical protein
MTDTVMRLVSKFTAKILRDISNALNSIHCLSLERHTEITSGSGGPGTELGFPRRLTSDEPQPSCSSCFDGGNTPVMHE